MYMWATVGTLFAFHFDFQFSFCFKTKWRASGIVRPSFDFAGLVLPPSSHALARPWAVFWLSRKLTSLLIKNINTWLYFIWHYLTLTLVRGHVWRLLVFCWHYVVMVHIRTNPRSSLESLVFTGCLFLYLIYPVLENADVWMSFFFLFALVTVLLDVPMCKIHLGNSLKCPFLGPEGAC